MKQAGTLHNLLGSVVTAMGYEFVGYELQRQGRESLLRVYIDSENGIKLENCSRVSRQISAMLDVEDPIRESYTLEVSSPGIDRPLFELAHFEKFAGSRVRLRLQSPIKDRRTIVGILLRVEGENIHIKMDEEEIVVPFSEIEKAKLINVG